MAGRNAPGGFDMRMMIPLALVIALASSSPMADNRSSQAWRASVAMGGYAYNYNGGPPVPVLGLETARRRQLADRAADLINQGDCKGAYRLARKNEDYLMMARIDEVCAALAAP